MEIIPGWQGGSQCVASYAKLLATWLPCGAHGGNLILLPCVTQVEHEPGEAH